MSKLKAIFWDLGGVLLTNGWDVQSREKAAKHFELDLPEMQHRHEAMVADLETGHIKLDEYIKRAVFYSARNFTPDQFKTFMFEQSKPLPDALRLLEKLRDTNQYLLGTLNNESKELNAYRVETFELKKYFNVFFNSGDLGVRKPEPGIYKIALAVTQLKAEECVFIDDRAFNLELAKERNFNTILYKDVAQLQGELGSFGVRM